MLLKDLIIKDESCQEKESCKGLIYKVKENNFINKRGDLVHKKTFVLQKRISCKGCANCDCIQDYLQEFENDPFIEDKFSDGTLVTPVWRDASNYFEDDAYIIFKKVNKKEETNG